MALGKWFKRFGRKTAKLHAKINRISTPIIAAGAGFIGGAPAAAAVTAIGAQAGYYFRSTQARNEGIMGRDARARGRGERKRVAIYGAAGGGAGMLASGLTNLFAGKSVISSLGATAFGQGGNALLFGSDTSALFAKAENVPTFITAANFAGQKASPVPGLVTQSSLNPSLAGGSTTAEAAAAAAGKSGESSFLAKTLGLVSTIGERIPGTPQGGKPTGPGSDNSYQEGLLDGLLSGMGGGGGGGDSGGGGGGFLNPFAAEEPKSNSGLLAAVAIGAYLLAS